MSGTTISVAPLRGAAFNDQWPHIKETVQDILNSKPVDSDAWTKSFDSIYNLCDTPHYSQSVGPNTYALHIETKRLVENYLRQKHVELSSCSGEDLLSAYHESWITYEVSVAEFRTLFSMLNASTYRVMDQEYYLHVHLRSLPSHFSSLQSVEEIAKPTNNFIHKLCMRSWYELIMVPLMDTLIHQVLAEIDKERNGESANSIAIHDVIRSFVGVMKYETDDIPLYRDSFEPVYLVHTAKYYEQESQVYVDSYDCTSYMIRVEMILQEEYQRSSRYLPKQSHEKVASSCHQSLVAGHLHFFYSACAEMFADDDRWELGQMYQLLHLVEYGTEGLVEHFCNHITQIAIDTVENLKPDHNLPARFVDCLSQVHSKYTAFIKDVCFGFGDNPDLMPSLDMAFEAAVNHRPRSESICRAAELIARYCDSLLKTKTTIGMSDCEITDKLERAMTIFRYVDSKDLYLRFHSRLLAKRLLQGLSRSMNAERDMVARLKRIGGYEYTQKLEQMFMDMDTSGKLDREFSECLTKEEIGINVACKILRTGAWTVTYCNFTFRIPPELQQPLQVFESFYRNRYNRRKLNWMHSLGTVDVEFNYLEEEYLVTMGTLQMALLPPFNTQDSRCVADLQASTQLPEDELIIQAQSLVDAGILQSNTPGPVNSHSTLVINTSYTNTSKQFALTSPPTSRVVRKEAEKSAHVAVDGARKNVTQAAVVRIMKAHRVLKDFQLVEEVLRQTRERFSPDVSMIITCIATLVEKEYIERSDSSPDEYCYIP